MTRLTPTAYFKEIFPDRRDPDNPRHFLCRFCGKPTTNTRRSFWCSDECHDLCQKAVSWLSARKEVWIRDNGECVRCGEPVLLYDGWRKVGKGKDVTNCHHVKPVNELWGVAWDAVHHDEWEQVPTEAKTYWYCRFYVMLYLDINNLITLCPVCHKMIHSADLRNQLRINPFKVARTKWGGFWNQIEIMKCTRTLEEFLVA